MKGWFCLSVALAISTGGCGPDGSPVAWDEEGYSQYCPMPTIEGIDVYQGDGAIDWTKVKGSGRDFAFIKATQGGTVKESTFAANWKNSKSAGVLRSPYHFFDATVDGATQATWFLDNLSQAGGLEDSDIPPMIDLECPTASTQGASSPTCTGGSSGWAPTATITQRLFDLLDAIEQATGRKSIIYSYPAWFASTGVTDARLADYPLFIATYAACPGMGSCASVPAPWTTAAFWQYNVCTMVPGLTGSKVDQDRFFGTLADLTAFIAGSLPGGADGGGGPSDLPPSKDANLVDAAEPLVDASRAPPDSGHTVPKKSNGGCACDLTTGAPPTGFWLLLALVIGRSLRRSRCWARRRSPASS